MKNRLLRQYFLFFSLCGSTFSQAQNNALRLATGEQKLSATNSEASFKIIKEKAGYKGRYYWIARFSSMPGATEKNVWQKEGLQFHSRLGDRVYLVSSTLAPNIDFARQHRIIQTAAIDPQLKISRALSQNRFAGTTPAHGGRISLLAAVIPGIPLPDIKSTLKDAGILIEPGNLESNHILSLLASPQQFTQLAAFPFIQYIQPIAVDRILNEKARFMSGAFALNAPVADGGYNLKGNGVVVGVGDDTDPSLHPDLRDRIINRTPGIVYSHGAHVTGTIAGAGLLQPDRRGFAPLATIVSQLFTGIWMNAAQYIQDFGMVITNNSYGAQEGDCDYNGAYDLYSQVLDDQAAAFPQLLHVFSSGNSGDDVCSPYPQHYYTVLGSYQAAKNVITVGRTDYNQLSSGSSSSGPVKDGRLKPEVTALGIIESTDGGSGYFGAYGTSQSAPAISGGLALLYERYRQLFGGSNPPGALMKAVLLDGARDIGTPGPDYRHGYGFIHLENSIRILDNHQYFGGSLSQGGAKDSVVTVPAGTAQLKVMLYWHDPSASPLATKTLMNDLDLEVIRPDGTTIVYPKKLNPSDPAAAATEGPDHLNNSEQVVIETPVAGNYTIRVKGFEIFSTPAQDYYTAFDFVPTGVAIRTPVKGDTWSVSSPDEFGITGVIISWDDEGTGNGTYKLEYSLDNGASWFPIIDNVSDDDRYYGWRPPAGTATNQAKVRITKNNTSFTSTSETFSILDRPAYSIAANPCEGYITVNWTAVPGADDYEVIMKQGPQMVPVAVVAPPVFTYTISGLNKDSSYYVAVRARKGGIAGRWRKANPSTPNSGGCAGTISDGDLKLDSIISPVYGRQFTSTTLGASENLKVRIKNLDNSMVAAGSFNVKFSLDGAPFISQPGAAAIPALGTYVHTFSGVDLSATGSHTIKAVVENTALTDKVPANDTFSITVKNLLNPPVSVASTFIENFDAAPAFSLSRSTIGLPGLDRWDYFNSDKYARARSFVNTGIALSGNRAMTLDVSKATTTYLTNPANNLQGTFNLTNYTTSDDIRLDFEFKHHGPAQVPNAQNRVWVRGSDNSNWVEAYDLSKNQPIDPGTWKKSSSIELNDLLSGANPVQQFSSSLQVRFGQYAEYGMADNFNLAGYTFDDIRLYIAVNDMQMLGIDTPAIYSCGLNNAVPVKVTVRNSTGNPISNIPVSYTVNGGVPVTETIAASIPANGEFVYQFITPANLSANGVYTIEASVNIPGDNVPDNNKAVAVINNQPVISSYPYLENFESGTGSYFVTGNHPSWQWGTPASIKMDTAASGTKAWKTRLAGNYNDREFSQLNSPCFDISALVNPMLSFSLAYDIEDCTPYGFVCDASWVEYSTDGVNWQKLGSSGQGTNWYDNADNDVWLKRKQSYWHVASIPLPKGSTSLRIRFVFYSDDATNYEGVAIDDIHIYDRVAPMYTSVGASNPVSLLVAGNTPVNFTDGGKLIATILPNNNNLGNTEVKAYIFKGPVRNYSQQYYGNRNITIKPSNTISGNATVRFYFSDKEADSMRLATSCAACTNPKDYTHLGVTQYTDGDKTKEDGDLVNNTNGISHFINDNQLTLIPYDAGYYAEFNISTFSEFWLNDGKGIDQPLPGRWLSFEAVKQSNEVVKLTWSTANETAISHYEIEVANSKAAVNNNQFESIGKTNAKNTPEANYTFLDQRTGKSGDFYYRIKQVDSNGNIFYSPVILVQFGLNDFEVKMYPNPVKDNLVVALQTTDNKKLQLKVYNMAGQLLYSQNWLVSSGNSQQTIPFKKLGISKGVYTVAISDGKSWWYGKIVKE